MAGECGMCGGGLKPLFSSFFCPACDESEARHRQRAGTLSVTNAVHYLSANLPAHCTLETLDGQGFMRWTSADRVTVVIRENLSLLSVAHHFFMRGRGCTVGYLDGILDFLGARR